MCPICLAALLGSQQQQQDHIAKCFEVIAKLAAQEGLTGGYRVISNCGDDAGQTVHHLHFHVLGGAPMGEKLL